MTDQAENSPETMTRKDFAALIGVSRAYLSQLAKAGRLVLTPDGRRIVVEASKQRIDDTKDPARQDVAERWEGYRKGEVLSYSDARARKETALAEHAEIDLKKRKGELCEVADVESYMQDLATKMRAVLENLPDRLSPEITPITDETCVHALVVEHVEMLLLDISAWSDGVARALAGDQE